MRLFAKFTVLCNACFLVAVVLWFIEMNKKRNGSNELAIPLSWAESTFVILGYGAIVINALFLLVHFIFVSLKVEVRVARWMVIFNLLMFCAQVFFHFFFK